MNLSRFDRLAIGLVLVLVIFSLELTSQLSGVLYLISAIYIFRFSKSSKQALTLAVATTLAIIAGYFLVDDAEVISAEPLISRIVLLTTVWICFYSNLRFKNLMKNKKEDVELIKSLTAQKEQAINQLQTAHSDLMHQADKRRLAEQELLNGKGFRMRWPTTSRME